MTDDDLPPLPKLWVGLTGNTVPWVGYTAEQMLDYARAAVAAERKRMADELLRWERDEREHANASDYTSGRLAGLHDAAWWVRAQGATK